MKVLSASDRRPQDVADLRALVRAGLDVPAVLGLLQQIAAAGCARDQDLAAKLQGFLESGR